MGFFNNFPYTNFHELNLDWILKNTRMALDRANKSVEAVVKNEESIESIKNDVEAAISKIPEDIKETVLQMVDSGDIETILQSSTEGFVSVLDFGAKGDGVTDDTAAFKTAIEFCIENNKGLYVPAVGRWNNDGGYILSETLNIDYPMWFMCAPNAILNWKNVFNNNSTDTETGRNNSTKFTHGYGINIDYGTYGGHKGYYRFGIVQGDKHYTEPGGSEPSGNFWKGIRIANGDLVDLHAVYISYWGTGIVFESPVNITNNNMVSFGVMDDCATGIEFNATDAIQNTQIRFNTIGICRRAIYFAPNVGTVDSLDIYGSELFTEYPGYETIFNGGNKPIVNCRINIVRASNRNTMVTTLKTGSTDEWTGPIIDGANGGFLADSCIFKLGVYNGNMGAGDPISFNVRGYNNKINNTWRMLQGSLGSPIPFSLTELESDFNGGIGGALWANHVYMEWTTDKSYNVGDEVTLYGFSQMLNNLGGETPIFYEAVGTHEKIVCGIESESWQNPRRFKMAIKFREECAEAWKFKFLVRFGF